jgi:hypothetical protein
MVRWPVRGSRTANVHFGLDMLGLRVGKGYMGVLRDMNETDLTMHERVLESVKTVSWFGGDYMYSSFWAYTS